MSLTSTVTRSLEASASLSYACISFSADFSTVENAMSDSRLCCCWSKLCSNRQMILVLFLYRVLQLYWGKPDEMKLTLRSSGDTIENPWPSMVSTSPPTMYLVISLIRKFWIWLWSSCDVRWQITFFFACNVKSHTSLWSVKSKSSMHSLKSDLDCPCLDYPCTVPSWFICVQSRSRKCLPIW